MPVSKHGLKTSVTRSGKKNEIATASPAKEVIGTGTVEEFFARARDYARKADAGVLIEPFRRVTFEDPKDLVAVLTPRRIELLRAVRKHSSSIAEIAAALNRDRRAVVRDVEVMEHYGLLLVKIETNPRHGRQKRIMAGAASFELRATL